MLWSSLVSNEISFLFDLLILDYSINLETAMPFSLFSDICRKCDQKLRGSFNKNLSSSLWVKRV